MRRLVGAAVVFLALMVGLAFWLRAQHAPLPLPENWSNLPEGEQVRFLLRYTLSIMYPQNWFTRAVPPQGKVPAEGAEKTTEFELPEVHDINDLFVREYLLPVLRLTPAEKDRIVHALKEWLRRSPEDSHVQRAERAAELMRLLGRYEEAAALIYTIDLPPDEKHGYIVEILISMMNRRESGIAGNLNRDLGLFLGD